MIVKFSCDCIGILGIQGDSEDRPLIISPCDHDSYRDSGDPGIYLYRRDMGDKDYEPLPAEKAVKYVERIESLISDGGRFRAIKDLLK